MTFWTSPRLNRGNLELEQHPFSLPTCIEEALDLLAAKATEKGLELAYWSALRCTSATVDGRCDSVAADSG